MNKSKSLLVFSILLVMLLTLSIVPDQTSATATEIKPVSANPSPLFTPSEASNAGINQLPPMALGVVLVGLKPGVTVSTGLLGVQASDASLSAAFADIGVQSVEPIFPNGKRSMVVVSADSGIDLSSIYRLRLAPDADILRIVRDLSANPAVVYAEPDYLAHIIATPNDPLYSGQWGLSQINAPAAWDVITGTTDVVIAVIDSGLDTSHPDLAGQLWTNPGEIVGNGIDDDNNGYVDDINGWNFVDDNTNLSDNTGHGTQVAGVIAAETNNGKGVAGVCWNCHLMIVKVTQFGGVANYSDIAAGVTYAAQKGADVINLSLGGYSNSATLRAAVEAASQTVVVVGGAGNDDRTDLFYPAAYNDNVLAVAGTTSSDTKVGTSNYGTWVDVSAPGEVITTTFSGGGYGDTSGTSMAAPFVAGLAGLLRSKNPGWSADMVRAQIIRTANDIYGLNPSYGGQLGNGRINADQAVTTAAQPLLTYQSHIVDGETNGRPEPGSTVDLDVVLFNEWANATNVQATLSTTDTYATVITGTASYEDIAVYKNKMNATSFRVSISDLTPDAYDIPFVLYVAAAGDYVTTVPFTVTTSAIQQVSGVISTDTIWRAGIEYIVTGNIMVPTGITLTIEPGTTVRVHGERSFHIEGKLVADGAADAVIQFTSATQAPSSESDYWSGILFINGGEGLFTHCWFEYLNEGAIQVNDGSLLVERSFFTKNKEDVLVVSSSGYAIVKYNRFWNNSTGGAMYPIILQGDVAFSNNLVYDNIADVGAILQPSQGIVVSNTIINNSANGLETALATGFHHNNLLGNEPYDVHAVYAPVTMTAVYWGEETTIEMEAEGPNSNIEAIYDYYDDFTLSRVDYTGWLTTPEPTAPAFLWRLSTDPADPIGIQQMTFVLTFSRPMDQSSHPSVAFGVTEPYTSFVVSDNTKWLSDRVWSATYDVTSLVPRGTYTISISDARDATTMMSGTLALPLPDGGIEIPPDTRFGFTVDYASEITDKTPPHPPLVTAEGKEGDASTVQATWSANDPDSSIIGYRYAIGSAAGAIDIVNWTPTDSNSIIRSGLGLIEGRQYWLAVQARNEGGLWSASGYSAFVAGRPFHRIFLPLVIRNQ